MDTLTTANRAILVSLESSRRQVSVKTALQVSTNHQEDKRLAFSAPLGCISLKAANRIATLAQAALDLPRIPPLVKRVQLGHTLKVAFALRAPKELPNP
jgi:hypothetical protein